ncbi:MAG: LysR family transcriptional regulator [Rhodospirillaceae bacterium]|nr:LysR family transcriptional regulator [Rhodospirillaceae bacterium]
MARQIDHTKLYRLSVVLDERSFSLAAKKLGVSQPALSQSIAQFEAELGVKLVERGRNGITPTVYGRSLYDHAKIIRSEVDRAQESLHRLLNGERGTLSIGALSGLPVSLASWAICSVQDGRANILLNLFEELSSAALLTRLVSRELDVIICHPLQTKPGDDIVQRPLVCTERVVVVRAQHPIVQDRKFRLEDLAQFDFTCPPRDSDSFAAISDIFRRSKLALPNKNYICSNSLPAAKEILLKSDAFGVLSEASIASEVAQGMFKTFRFNVPTEFWYRLIVRRGQGNTAEIVAFLRGVLNVCKSRNIGLEPTLGRGMIQSYMRPPAQRRRPHTH